jgi:hypothetical protein
MRIRYGCELAFVVDQPVKCRSALWREAIKQGWKIELSGTSSNGGRVSFGAKC